MVILPGTRLGPFEVIEPLGAGGMGEVYRARDTRLGRDVAIKVLRFGPSSSEDLRQRFEREARTISQIAHPNICALYDVGREGDLDYLVMELLAGETLAARIARGALPFEEALRIGGEIAAALGAAHAIGIVHRDLKPANVMLTKSGARLLDFGLARTIEASGGDLARSTAGTEALPLTEAGSVLGTAPYMAPEQHEGKPADARADVFALGAVLFEMATGRRAFEGESRAEVTAAVLRSVPPPVSSLRPGAPPAFDRLVRTCLEKEPAARWASAHDLALRLREIAEDGRGPAAPAARATRSRVASWTPWALAAAALLASGALLARLGARDESPPTIRFSVAPPAEGRFRGGAEGTMLALSPDGSRLAYVAADSTGAAQVWIRPLAAIEATPVAGTEDANSVFWSPDGKSLGFFTPGMLKRVDLEGGAPITLCALESQAGHSGSWGPQGDILFASVQGVAISRVSASGGTPASVVRADSARGESALAWPWFLPDGRRFLYLRRTRDGEYTLMLGAPGEASREVMKGVSRAEYMAPGVLVFVRDGTLLAQRFDWRGGRVSGAPQAVSERVGYFLSTGWANFSSSSTGTIAYHAGADVQRLAWFDLAGRRTGTVGPRGDYLELRIAPDGRRVFCSRAEPRLGTYDIWALDLERDLETRITSEPNTEFGAILLPDGKHIVYSSVRGGPPHLLERNLETGADTEILPAGSFQVAQDVTRDGKTLLYAERSARGAFDLWSVALAGGAAPVPVLRSPAGKSDASLSPDGRYLAFLSEDSGTNEAYVMPYPGPGERTRISTAGARALRWSRDGREIVYLTRQGGFWSVAAETRPALRLGEPKFLFALGGKLAPTAFDLSPDGRRILAPVPESEAGEAPVTVIAGWVREFGR